MKATKIYTTGVYDLFHIGHLNLLNRAKDLGDFLVVGVSTDEFVELYKGKKPVIPFEERFKIIESIRCVDKVVIQNSTDKATNMELNDCDIFAVGDDWKDKKIMGEEEILKSGKTIWYLSHTAGISTTILRRRMENHGK